MSFQLKVHSLILLTVLTFFDANAQQVKIMSYNIGSTNWSITQDSVIARITVNNPDVFCAVEAGQNKRPFLESSLPTYRLLQTFGATPNICESHIFLKKDMFSVLDSGYIQMPTYVGYTKIGRYLNWARLKHNISQEQFIIYGSHFLAPVGANVDSARVGQYRHANAMMQQMSLDTNLNIPQITVGDFNAGVSSDLMKYLINQIPITFNGATITNPIDLEDSWVIANSTATKPATTFTGSSAIDWILTTPNTHVLNATIDDKGIDGGVPPSDHKPLQITIDIGSTVSINETSKMQSINVYPNPFQNRLYFEMDEVFIENISLELFDINGRLVYSLLGASHINGSVLEIDCSSLNNGIYFYFLTNSNKSISGKIILRKGIR
ncbi:MAG: hypothetical protein COA58_14000 [Bacteroidetes bacterium]|nr:MAG: hypothetical protein COA58_14000 [Bacteroidota bacterium]